MPWGFAAAAVGTIASSVLGGNAASDAAQTQATAATQSSKVQADAANQATQAQLQMFGQTQANEQPFLQAGANALPILQAGIGATDGTGVGPLNAPFDFKTFGLSDFQHSPGYQFQMQQGEDAVLNNASRMGGVNSGNTLKALTQFGQGTANQDYWNAYNAFTNNQLTQYNAYTTNQNQRFNQLQNLTGSGQNAAASLGSLGSNVASNIGNIQTGTAANIGNNIVGAGNSISAGQVAGGQAMSNAFSGAGNNYLLYSMLNGGFGGGGGVGTAYDPSNVALFGGG